MARQVRADGWDTCIVVHDRNVVFGRLFKSELEATGTEDVEQVMRSGPSTFRPNVTVEEMVRFMDDRGISTALVTTSDGKLVGLLRRTDMQTGEGS